MDVVFFFSFLVFFTPFYRTPTFFFPSPVSRLCINTIQHIAVGRSVKIARYLGSDPPGEEERLD